VVTNNPRKENRGKYLEYSYRSLSGCELESQANQNDMYDKA